MSGDVQRSEHWAHVVGGALLVVAGAAELAAGARRGDRPRARAGATAAALGWLTIRYAGLSVRLRRAEVASGAWQLLTDQRPASGPVAVPPAPSPPAGPPWSWAPYRAEWPPRGQAG